jgi:hypothetical protein
MEESNLPTRVQGEVTRSLAATSLEAFTEEVEEGFPLRGSAGFEPATTRLSTSALPLGYEGTLPLAAVKGMKPWIRRESLPEGLLLETGFEPATVVGSRLLYPTELPDEPRGIAAAELNHGENWRAGYPLRD